MRVVVQRVKNAKCIINDNVYSEIDNGLLLLVGFTEGDNEADLAYFAKKIVKMRIFSDNLDKLNLSILDIRGKILSISQFTLYGWPYNGNRPSFTKALNYDEANLLYQKFNQLLNEMVEVKTGIFGANMQIELTNDGPLTILLDSNDIKEVYYGK